MPVRRDWNGLAALRLLLSWWWWSVANLVADCRHHSLMLLEERRPCLVISVDKRLQISHLLSSRLSFTMSDEDTFLHIFRSEVVFASPPGSFGRRDIGHVGVSFLHHMRIVDYEFRGLISIGKIYLCRKAVAIVREGGRKISRHLGLLRPGFAHASLVWSPRSPTSCIGSAAHGVRSRVNADLVPSYTLSLVKR
jgi:hypothetical protein